MGKVVARRISWSLSSALRNEGFLRRQRFHPRGTADIFQMGSGGRQEAEISGEVSRERRSREEAKPSLVASLVVGLNSGDKWGDPKERFKPEDVRDEAMKRFPDGGTLAIQLGWYKGEKEDSVRLSIENSSTGLGDEEFQARVEGMADDFIKKFRQDEILVDLYRGDKYIDGFRFRWNL